MSNRAAPFGPVAADNAVRIAVHTIKTLAKAAVEKIASFFNNKSSFACDAQSREKHLPIDLPTTWRSLEEAIVLTSNCSDVQHLTRLFTINGSFYTYVFGKQMAFFPRRER